MTTNPSKGASPADLDHPIRLALVGDRSASVSAHGAIPEVLAGLAVAGGEIIEPYWLHSSTISEPEDLAGFDGIWAVPGSPYANPAGVLAAIEYARTHDVAFLGTCGGFQHVLLELAYNVCGLSEVRNAEEHPEAAELLIAPLRCALFGEEAPVEIRPGTVAAEAMGAGVSTERYFCRYGLNPAYLEPLVDAGLVVSGVDEDGDTRVVELPANRFFVAALFQPELSSDSTWAHPLIAAFSQALRSSRLSPLEAGSRG